MKKLVSFKTIPVIIATCAIVSCGNPPLPPDTNNHEIGFPAQISLAALGVGSTVKQKGQQSCIVRKNDPSKSEDNFNQLVDKIILEKALDKTLPLNSEQRHEALTLIQSGQFKKDLSSSIKKMYITNSDLPIHVVGEVSDVSEAINIASAFSSDLEKYPNLGFNPVIATNCLLTFRKFMQDAGKHYMPKECLPLELNNTLDAVYGNASFKRVAKTVSILVEKDNRSFRLAIIAYARSNGINITDQDLDNLSDLLKTDKKPDLKRYVEEGLRRYSEENGLGDIEKAKTKINTFDRECSIN